MKSLAVCDNLVTSGRKLIPLALAGYLYFHAAPDSKSFYQECVRRVKNLHTADCLRANK